MKKEITKNESKKKTITKEDCSNSKKDTQTYGKLDQTTIYKSKCSLYMFSKEKKKFIDRGVGEMMILKESDSKLVKLVMIRDGIKRQGCNHYINPLFKLQNNLKLNNAWIWATTEDSVDNDKETKKMYLVKFEEDEDFEQFSIQYEEGRINNKEVLEGRNKEKTSKCKEISKESSECKDKCTKEFSKIDFIKDTKLEVNKEECIKDTECTQDTNNEEEGKVDNK